MANYYQNLEINGLGTITTTIPIAGTHFFDGKLTLPGINKGSSGASAVVVTITQNGPTVYTGVAGANGFRTDITCAVGDVIGFVLTSAAAVDQPLNAVKGVIALGVGQ